MIEYRTKAGNTITNYLDDFHFVAFTIACCNYLITSFIKLCQEVGVPISDEKTVWACMRLVFLGILLDGTLMIIAIPEEKKNKAIHMLSSIMQKKESHCA